MATRIKAKKAKSKTRKQAKAKSAKPASKGKERRPDGLLVGSTGGKLVDLVTRKGGVTHAEACAELGWKSCMPFLLKSAAQAGVTLRRERQGRAVRLYGSRA